MSNYKQWNPKHDRQIVGNRGNIDNTDTHDRSLGTSTFMKSDGVEHVLLWV